ncbi:hypothetical protein [Micromonospora sp. NBC_00421]|uniref:hypothetical protein n=1 Tax=Micromonospora sp. NBC_00421 TaxID=2975976 RepID=UPI002E1C1943
MGARINRLVHRTVAVCAVLAALAFHHNHVTQPCGAELGAGGMCVSISLES